MAGHSGPPPCAADDVAVAVEDMEGLAGLLGTQFRVARHPHSLNISVEGSDLRIQVQTDRRYAAFAGSAEVRVVLGQPMRVAALADVLRGKVWAASDPERRGSKRQKDLADISRPIEAYPHLRAEVPAELLARLL